MLYTAPQVYIMAKMGKKDKEEERKPLLKMSCVQRNNGSCHNRSQAKSLFPYGIREALNKVPAVVDCVLECTENSSKSLLQLN